VTNRSAACTILLVTHNSAIAEIADRVCGCTPGTVARQERVAAPVQAQDLDW
jgi:putative ABC transport system ATP-binding protein